MQGKFCFTLLVLERSWKEGRRKIKKMKTKRPQTGYKSNSRRAPVDTDAGKTGLFYLYRVAVDAATVFIAERLCLIAAKTL